MGASFCNLYCKNEHADSLKERLPKDSRLLTGYGEWSVLLLQEFNTRKLMYLARFIPGDVLIFYLYDDEAFGLYYYRDGKKLSFLDCGEYNQKVRKMAENLFPEDPLALKKLWAIKRGVSVDEKLALLEETFGLPFDAAYEQEEIPPVPKSSETYDRMNAGAKALRNRLNRYQPELLPREVWPASLQGREGKFFPDSGFVESLRALSEEHPCGPDHDKPAGHYLYTFHETKDHGWEIVRTDPARCEESRIRLELPIYPLYMILSGACLCCGVVGFTFDSVVFFGWDGKVISRHHLEHIWHVWEEAGKLYGVARDDQTHHITGVYLFREKAAIG